MKTILLSLLLFINNFSFSQTITAYITRWTHFDIPDHMCLDEALKLDSINLKSTSTGSLVYYFDLDNKLLSIYSTDSWKSELNIVVIYPSTQSILNVDVEQNGVGYNILLTENVDDKISLVIQNFDVVKNRRPGVFSNDVNWVTEMNPVK
jgi:hypothetical protein